MKYKVGDKVKYYSGEWWFYGTVSAIIENSISPCYRLSVERMEKTNCKFSITQFEFELGAEKVEKSNEDKRKTASILETVPKNKKEKNHKLKQKSNPGKTELMQVKRKEPVKRKTSKAWDKNLELYRKGGKSGLLNAWVSYNRKQYNSGELAKDKHEKLMEINFPFDVERKKNQIIRKTKQEKS